MTLNCIAAYLIITKSKKEINEYRKLLVIFLICGFFFAMLHLIIRPVCLFNLHLLSLFFWIFMRCFFPKIAVKERVSSNVVKFFLKRSWLRLQSSVRICSLCMELAGLPICDLSAPIVE